MDEKLESRIETMISKLRERRTGPVPEPVATLQAELKAFLARYEQPLERVFSETEVRALLGEALAQPPPAPVEEGPSVSALSNAFESLRAADSQPAILKYLVGFLSRQYERVAIFMVREREQTAVGWLVRGFARSEDQKSVRKEAISLAAPSVLKQVLDSRVSVLLDQPAGDGLYRLLAVPEPARAMAWPIKLHKRVGVILYGDQVQADRELGYLKELELILPFAEKALEVLALRARLGGPAAGRAAAPAASTAAAVEEAPAPVAAAAVEPATEAAGPPRFGGRPMTAFDATEEEMETRPTQPVERLRIFEPPPPPPYAAPMEEGPPLEREEALPSPPDLIREPAQQLEEVSYEPPAAEEPLPSFATSMPSLGFESIEAPSLEPEIEPSPAPIPLAPPAVPVPTAAPVVAEELPDAEARALQKEARKFARLLVYEIKLYNEDKVEEGRRHGDLYDRLRLDIERSLEVFNERYPEAGIRSSYFDDYLVEILADGKPELLGPRM